MITNRECSFENGFNLAIDGAGGAGKTTLAAGIADHFGINPESQIIHSDHYLEPVDKNGVVSVDGTPCGINVVRLMRQVGDAINNPEKPFAPQEYVWDTDSYKDLLLPDRKQLIVVEGIKLIGLPVLWDAKVWVDTPRESRVPRSIKRRIEDPKIKETDEEVLLKQINIWSDDAKSYQETIDPFNREDIWVVMGDAPLDEQVDQVSSLILSTII